MSVVDFPNNPAPGQTFTSGSKTWTYNGTGWALSRGPLGTVSAARPAAFNPNTNQLQVAGTVSQFNAALSDGDFVTTNTPQTLTNKTITAPAVHTPVVRQEYSHTLTAADASTIIEMNDSIPSTLTVPADSAVNFPTGTRISVVQTGEGEVSFASGSVSSPSTATTWVTQNANFAVTSIFTVAYGNGLWLLGGYGSNLRRSTDAITWATQAANFFFNVRSLAYANNLWVGVGYFGDIRTSTDGTTWVTSTSNFGSTNIYTVAYGNGTWVAAGYRGQVRTSTDAVTWVTRTSNFGTSLIIAVAHGGGSWVMTGAAGQIRTSTDAVTWTTRTSNVGGTTTMRTAAYGNGLWLVAGNGGNIRTSTDTVSWVTRNSNFGSTVITTAVYGGSVWVAGGNSGQIRTSTDGVSWATQTSNFGTTIRSIAYGAGTFVAVGDNAQLRVSFGSDEPVSLLSASSPAVISSRYGRAELFKRAANTWILSGDVGA